MKTTAFPPTQARSAGSLELAIGVCAALLLAGCWSGPSVGPQLGRGGHDKSSVPLTAERVDDQDKADDQTAAAGSGADVADAGMGDEPAQADDLPVRPMVDPNVASGDDSVRCGDGVLDANEICDIGITGGKRGECVTDCGKDPCAKLQVHGCMTQCVTDTSKSECAPEGQ